MIRKEGVIILIAMVFVSSCAVPEMQLQHNPKSQTNTYSTAGTIEVLEFKNDIHGWQKMNQKYGKSFEKSKTWTGYTVPSKNEFLKTTIEQEIAASGLFTISDNAEYELSGVINTINNTHKDGGGKEASHLLGLIGCFIYPVLIPATISLVANTDKITSLVNFEATLKKNGIPIWEDEINVLILEFYPTAFKIKPKQSMDSAEILDKAVTQAVREMIKKMDEEVKLQTQPISSASDF